MSNLIDSRKISFSQCGEDGIVQGIFEVIGPGGRFCCEFGAWDGIHLSNTRALIESGWGGLMIEADAARFQDLLATYRGNAGVVCVNALVDAAGSSLASIMRARGLASRRIDFLSIDLAEPPRVVCVECHTCHDPTQTTAIETETAARGISQPLGVFAKTGAAIGYRLVCFLGTNAFFVHRGEGGEEAIPTLSPQEAWQQNFAIFRESRFACEFLFLANLGLASPFYRFGNPRLSASALGISALRALLLRMIPRDGELRPTSRFLRRWSRPPRQEQPAAAGARSTSA
jgi:hypothetical protein